MRDIKIEKEYDVRIIASIMENAFLCNTVEEIFDCAEALIDEEVDIFNYQEKHYKVIREIKSQYPYIKRITPYPGSDLNSDEIRKVCNYYIFNYGKTIPLRVLLIRKKILKPYHFNTNL